MPQLGRALRDLRSRRVRGLILHATGARFSRGDDYLGTADLEVNYWLSQNPTFLAVTKVSAVVVGHVLGVIAAFPLAPDRSYLTGSEPYTVSGRHWSPWAGGAAGTSSPHQIASAGTFSRPWSRAGAQRQRISTPPKR